MTGASTTILHALTSYSQPEPEPEIDEFEGLSDEQLSDLRFAFEAVDYDNSECDAHLRMNRPFEPVSDSFRVSAAHSCTAVKGLIPGSYRKQAQMDDSWPCVIQCTLAQVGYDRTHHPQGSST